LGHAYRPIEDAVQLRLVVELGKLRLRWFKLDSDIFAIFTILSTIDFTAIFSREK